MTYDRIKQKYWKVFNQQLSQSLLFRVIVRHHFVLFRWAIVLPVFLPFTVSDYPFGIFTLFLQVHVSTFTMFFVFCFLLFVSSNFNGKIFWTEDASNNSIMTLHVSESNFGQIWRKKIIIFLFRVKKKIWLGEIHIALPHKSIMICTISFDCVIRKELN